MTTFSKQLLSNSVSGKEIKINTVASPGTVLHVPPTGTSNIDEVWMWAVNHDTSARLLTVQWGDSVSPDSLIDQTIPAQGGLALIIPGLVIQNSQPIQAYASASGVVLVSGYVNRIT